MTKLDIDAAKKAVEAEINGLRTFIPHENVATRKRFKALADALETVLARVGELDARVGVLEGAVWKADGELSMIQGAVVGIASDLDRFDGASKKLGSNASRMLDSIRSRIFEGIDACARDARQALQHSSRNPPSLGVGEEDQAVASGAERGAP